MTARRASDVFVECLEVEGVKHVFGIPGEETLDLNESLADSSVEFVPVRHEQGGAYMADMYGRMTGRAGVCLGTLGPGAMNLVTAVGDAFLDRAPLVALTGQAEQARMHKESHQYIDLVELFKPITKWNARVSSPEIIPEVVRKAFKVAESEKPGSTHLELPEDVMALPVDAEPLPRRRPVAPDPGARELLKAVDLIRNALNPVALAGNGVVRAGAAPALREFARSTGIPVAETFMGKGVLDHEDSHALGTVGLTSRDYELSGFEDADVVITIGYDLVEHAPSHWNAKRDKKIVCIDAIAAEVDSHYQPEVELIGDIYHVLTRLGEECRDVPFDGPPKQSRRLRELVMGRLEGARDDGAFPASPPRALWEISSGRLQRASPWHQRCRNCSSVMAGCLPLSQWLSTPARSLMSDPTRSQSRRIRSLAAANTLAAMCAGVTWRSGRDREVQYAVQRCVMTRSLRRCHRLTS